MTENAERNVRDIWNVGKISDVTKESPGMEGL
jgi:hypothetical protein